MVRMLLTVIIALYSHIRLVVALNARYQKPDDTEYSLLPPLVAFGLAVAISALAWTIMGCVPVRL